MSRKIRLFYGLLLITNTLSAQKNMTVSQYIELYKKDAVKDMHKSGVPASITLAQAILESECGNSPLAKGSKNHFGIKCHTEWKGKTFKHDDDEKQECFRKYNDVLDSYEDHSDFLRSRSRYGFLFEIPMTDYRAWATGLKKAGYATNPKYPEMIVKIIEDNKLYELVPGGEPNIPVTPAETTAVQTTAMHKPVKEERHETTTSKSNYKHETPKWEPQNKTISFDNNVKFILAKSEDTYFSIASEYKMGLWQVFKYNDADKEDDLVKGERVYLAPKKRQATVYQHIVKRNETMRSISQIYAVKVKRLYKFNNMKKGEEPIEGQKLLLQKKRS